VTQGEAIAIGHSFGATLSLLAEAKHPGLFKTIILLDPPLFSRTKMVIISFLKKTRIGVSLHSRKEVYEET